MTEKTVSIENKLGLHARPASLIVQIASKYQSEILLRKDSTTANGRSIMSVMMLAAEKGSKLTIQANGEDEGEAVSAIAKLVEDGFNED